MEDGAQVFDSVLIFCLAGILAQMGEKEELTVTLFFKSISPVFARCYAFRTRFCQVCFFDTGAKNGRWELERLKMVGRGIQRKVAKSQRDTLKVWAADGALVFLRIQLKRTMPWVDRRPLTLPSEKINLP
jgi:hypothetical protein